MIKVEVIEDFRFSRYNELKNIQRKSSQENFFVKGDIFECTEEIADYLIKNNRLNRAFVKVIEIIPEKEKKEITKKEIKSKKLLQKNSDYGNI